MTECCGQSIAEADRFCPKCGWECRVTDIETLRRQCEEDAQYFEEEDVLGVANRIRALLALVDEQAKQIEGAREIISEMRERHPKDIIAAVATMNAQITTYIDLLADRDASLRAQEPQLEHRVREYLWLSHGHSFIYGDDGEMQCGECQPFGVVDYKREPLEKLLDAVHAVGHARMVKALAAAEVLRLSGGPQK